MKRFLHIFVATLISITNFAGQNDLLWDYTSSLPYGNPDNGLYYEKEFNSNGVRGIKLNSSGYAYFVKTAVAGYLDLTFGPRNNNAKTSIDVYTWTGSTPSAETLIANTDTLTEKGTKRVVLPANCTNIYLKRGSNSETYLQVIRFTQDDNAGNSTPDPNQDPNNDPNPDIQYEGVLVDKLYYNFNVHDHTAEVTYNENSKYSGYITIPSTVSYLGEKFDVTSIGGFAFSGCENLLLVSIPTSVTSIRDGAFWRCTGLSSVIIPNSVDSIGEAAFYYCTSMTSISIGDKVTTIGKEAFNGCSALTAISIPVNVNSIGEYAFSACNNLTSVTWNAKNCKTYHFENQITSFTFGNEVEVIPDSIFYGMNISSIIIPSSVKKIGKGAFMGNPLKSIEIPNTVTSIGEKAFYFCEYLTSAAIGNGVTFIDKETFHLCKILSSITIGNNVDSIGYGAFSGCKQLQFIVLPNSLQKIGDQAFSSCSSLESVTIPDNVKSIGTSAFYRCENLNFVNIPQNVTRIEDHTFLECTNLTSIQIPNSILYIGNGAFKQTGLTSVEIPNSVNHIENEAFYNCGNLTAVTVPENLSKMGYNVFNKCKNLTNVTWNVKELADFYSDSYSAFNGVKDKIKYITFGENVTYIPKYLIEGMNNLVTINLGNVNTWTKQNFTVHNSPLNTATLYLLGAEIKTLTFSEEISSIGSYTFINCAKMTEINIPSSVKSIGIGVFKNGSRLQKVSIGENVETIGDSAFANCPYLIEIHAGMEFPPIIDTSVFADCGDLRGIDCYVQEESMVFYKKTAVWKEFNLLKEPKLDPTSLNQFTNDQSPMTSKLFRDGRILILRGDRIYTLTGQEVK